ncbi:MAG: SWIM zinc finger family protein [Chloroflexota bacterium]
MSDRPEITLQQVRARASEQSFSRGENYYNTGAVSDTVRRGDEIEARCHGSYPEPYRVWIRVDASGIAATRCNCEYDWGGDCKHIVAVLLTYLHQPHKFEARQTLQAALLNRSKEDMVDIIMMMVNRYPDLQDIVDSPTPNEIVTGMVPLDTLSFRQELRNAFNEYDYDGYYEYGDSASGKAMNRVASVADRLAERGDWLNAAAVYRTVLEEFAEMDEGLFNLHDDGVFSSLYDITSSLEQCLTQPVVKDHDDECHAILQAILGIFIWDTKIGGYGLSDDTPEIILKHVRREDIPAIRRRVEEARDRRIKGSYGDWSAEVYNSFLTDLDMLDEVEPEIILERLRAQEMYHLLVNKLLEMNRVDEAVMVIQQNINSAYAWIQALNLLVEHNENAKARQVAEDILAGEYDYELAEWLLDRYKAEDNKEEILQNMHRWHVKSRMQTIEQLS